MSASGRRGRRRREVTLCLDRDGAQYFRGALTDRQTSELEVVLGTPPTAAAGTLGYDGRGNVTEIGGG
jgi:hypothetical protein